MKIQTFTAVVGGAACNARCKFCVSRQTPPNGVTPKPSEVNWRNLDTAIRLATAHGVTTCLLTGKGEPTLWPDLISDHLEQVAESFPLIELQTNGIPIADGRITDARLADWRSFRLTTVAISVVHHDPARNAEQYTPGKSYIDLPALIGKLHGFGFSVRLCCMLLNGYIDTPAKVLEMAEFAHANGVAQLTCRPIRHVEGSGEVADWTRDNTLDYRQRAAFEELTRGHVEGQPAGRLRKVMTIPHVGPVFDVAMPGGGGQNLCLADCLTLEPDADSLRQIIFFPDGAIRYDWRYPGTRLL